MSQLLKNKGQKFADFLANLSEEECKKGNEEEFRRTEDEHKRFKAAHKNGHCYLCGKPLKSFSKKSPCIHWLLKPKGFKNKNIVALSDQFGFFQIQSLLRWYANEETFARNINNLSSKGTDSKLVELSIKYKNLEWSFSCTEADFEGHINSKNNHYPHYHFQMKIDKRPFIEFSDFQLALSDYDVINMEAIKSKPDLISGIHSFGEGMEEVFNNAGTEISDENFDNLTQEANEKGVTVTSLLHKVSNTNAQIMITPSSRAIEKVYKKSIADNS